MKTSKILSLVGVFFLMSMFFGSCKDDQQVAPAPNGKTHTIHLDLTANVVKQISVSSNTSKGFTLDVQHSGNSKTEAIKWGSDTWNNVTNKPKLIGVVQNKSLHNTTKVWALSDSEYEYNPGHGNKPAQVTIYSDVNVSGTESEYKVLFYLMDKNQVTDLQSTSGNISFDSGVGLYDVSGSSPVFQKELGENVFVHPNDRVFFNFIFQGEIDLSSYKSKGVKNFNMKPLGSLLMVDFSPREENEELDNPGAVDGFAPSLTTNAFDLIGSIDLTSAKNTNTTDTKYTHFVKFESYDESDTSTDPIHSRVAKISKSTPSDIYVKYVLPRAHSGYSLSISNNYIALYKYNSSSDNFYTLFNTKKVGLTLKVTSGSIKTIAPVKYNPLIYVAEWNVNRAKDGFNKENTNADNALVSWEDAKGLFSKPFLQGYHLPTWSNWCSVIISKGDVMFSSKTYSNPIKEFQNSKIGKAVLSDVKSAYKTIQEGDNYVTYAIRFISATLVKDEDGKDPEEPSLERTKCPYLSLWRYSYIDNPNGGGKMMDIYCYLLPKNYKVDFTTDNKFRYLDGSTWTEFTNKKFFEDRKDSGAVHRVFPTAGRVGKGNQAKGSGSIGWYWSATEYNADNIYVLNIESSGARSFYVEDSGNGKVSVRPFVGSSQE